MAAFSQRGCTGEPRRTGTHDGHAFLLGGWPKHQFRFVASAWIDQARGALLLEHVIEAGLIAADAGVDFVCPAGGGLVDELRISQKRPRHRHHVGTAIGNDFLGDVRRIDAIGGDQRDANLTLHFLRDPRKRSARHRGGNGRYPRFMPADTGVDDRRTGLLDGFRQHHHFVPGLAIGNKVQHR